MLADFFPRNSDRTCQGIELAIGLVGGPRTDTPPILTGDINAKAVLPIHNYPYANSSDLPALAAKNMLFDPHAPGQRRDRPKKANRNKNRLAKKARQRNRRNRK